MIDIERIKEMINLPALVGETVALKKRGNVWQGLCPFHEERSPSFVVYEKKFHCFGCGEHGDVIDWTAKRHGVEFRRAVEILGGGASYDTHAPALLKREARHVESTDPLPVWQQGVRDRSKVQAHAADLGVATSALTWLDIAWSKSANAWMFPQRDAHRTMIGIRYRNDRAEKWALKNGRAGLFLPNDECELLPTIYIAEGPTDTAALLTLGVYAVGRPSCLGQEEMLADFIRSCKIRRAVIVSDNDRQKKRSNGELFRPGLEGAQKLQSVLPCYTCLLLAPDGAKDIREWLNLGGTNAMLESHIKNLTWTRSK